MSAKFKELFILATKENARNRRIAKYNWDATLSQLIPYENRAFLNLAAYTLSITKEIEIGRD